MPETRTAEHCHRETDLEPDLTGREHWLGDFSQLLNQLAIQQSLNLNSEHVMNDQKSAPNLGLLLGGALSVWAVACFLTHGPVILAYIGFQAVTSGIFAWQMFRIQKLIPKHDISSGAGNEKVSRAA